MVTIDNHEVADSKASRMEMLFGDIKTFDLILNRVLSIWGLHGAVVPRDGTRYLFDHPSEFSGLCLAIRASEKGKRMCWECDVKAGEEAAKRGKPIDYICDSGLLDVAIPLIVNGRSVATILFGQRRLEGDPTYVTNAMQKLRTTESILGLPPLHLQRSWEEARTITLVAVDEAKAEVDRVANFLVQIAAEREKLQIKTERSSKLRTSLAQLSLSNLIEGNHPIDAFWRVLSDVFHQVCLILDAHSGKFLWKPTPREERFITKAQYPESDLRMAEFYTIPKQTWLALVKSTVHCSSANALTQFGLRQVLSRSDLVEDENTQVATVPIELDAVQKIKIILVFVAKAPMLLTHQEIQLPFYEQVDFFDTLATRIKAAYNSAQHYQDQVQLQEDLREYILDIAHQLQGPLSGIRAHSENLLRGRLPVQRGRVVLETLVEQAGFLQAYVQNIALASRFGEPIFDETEWHPKLYNSRMLVELLIKCTESFKGLAAERNIHGPSVDETSFRGLPSVMIDPGLFEILIRNLYDNAVKYSYEDTPITVVGRTVGNQVEIEVTNHGIPLDASDVDRIFLRHFRSDQAKEFHPIGTGVGLFICDQIAKLHHGSIRALPSKRSIYGNEVQIIVSLPVVKPKAS